MGVHMAGHLLEAGHSCVVYNRTPAKAQPLVDRGATLATTVAEVAEQADILFTIVGMPADVEEVYVGPEGLLAHAAPGSVAVDMTTSSPELARRLYEEGKAKGISVMDAPVSGGDKGARSGTLSIMIGGDRETFDALQPYWGCMGKVIVYQGEAGSGQSTKMANQIAIAGGMLGVCEAMAYAVESGLDPYQVLASIGQGAAGSWSLTNLAPKMLDGDFEPGFFVKHFIKDLTLALESAAEQNLDLPALSLALERYQALAESGGSEEGTQALIKEYLSEGAWTKNH
jgi:3-hydroxyisobutyrate dehydrogenase